MQKLLNLREQMQRLPIDRQIEILRLFKEENVVINENSNGVFINLSYYKETSLISKIENFLSYTQKQEAFIDVLEKEKKEIKDDMDKQLLK